MKNNHASLLERDRQYLRRHEVAEKLGVCASTIDKWVKAGKIPTVPTAIGRGRGRVVHFDWAKVCKALKIQP